MWGWGSAIWGTSETNGDPRRCRPACSPFPAPSPGARVPPHATGALWSTCGWVRRLGFSEMVLHPDPARLFHATISSSWTMAWQSQQTVLRKGENCTADVSVRYSEFDQKWAYHRVQPRAPCVHGSVHVHPFTRCLLHPLVSNAIKGADHSRVGSDPQLSWLLEMFFSLCCSYCLVLVLSLPLPLSCRLFPSRVSHTLLTD